MAEKPILFKGWMVRAILDGLKTQTRRVAKLTDSGLLRLRAPYAARLVDGVGPVWSPAAGDPEQPLPADRLTSPYGQPGDLLWVRETWGAPEADLPGVPDGRKPQPGDRIVYRANEADDYQWSNAPRTVFVWRPSIFMPKWACRLKPPITDVRVERLQDISATDCIAEGIERLDERISDVTVISRLQRLWDSINAKPKPVYSDKKIVSYVSYPWEDIRETREHRGKPWQVVGNPWLWVLTFEGPSQ